jgi:hypothetical protein
MDGQRDNGPGKAAQGSDRMKSWDVRHVLCRENDEPGFSHQGESEIESAGQCDNLAVMSMRSRWCGDVFYSRQRTACPRGVGLPPRVFCGPAEAKEHHMLKPKTLYFQMPAKGRLYKENKNSVQ